jgi:thioredoxin reductase
MQDTDLPIAIIGAGPVGLAAAAQLLERGLRPYVIEAGPQVGASIRAWGHVRLFSPWRYVVDQAAARLLEPTGWQSPDPDYSPTGGEFVRDYLEPLAALPALAPHIHTDLRVTAVTRYGLDKMKDAQRERAPFALSLLHADGSESQLLARSVIDASGTYEQPNPLGSNGVPALGERALQAQIAYGIPEVLGEQRQRYANKRILVVGSGHSAFNALLDLAQLAQEEPATKLTWAIRRSDLRQLFGGESDDQLAERGALGSRVRALVESGTVQLESGFACERIARTSDGLVLSSAERSLAPVDEVIVATGFRPNLELLRELRLDLDNSVEAPRQLAPLIDPNLHSCGSVPPHGVDQLSHPESGFFIVGMKSYGRAPTFLMLTGYEQVRSIADALAGNWQAARQVQLVLPETGVCSTDLGGSCCATPALPVRTGIDLISLVAAPAPSNNRGGCCS